MNFEKCAIMPGFCKSGHILAIPEKRQSNFVMGRKALWKQLGEVFMTEESSDEENECIRCHHLPWVSDGECMIAMCNGGWQIAVQQIWYYILFVRMYVCMSKRILDCLL